MSPRGRRRHRTQSSGASPRDASERRIVAHSPAVSERRIVLTGQTPQRGRATDDAGGSFFAQFQVEQDDRAWAAPLRPDTLSSPDFGALARTADVDDELPPESMRRTLSDSGRTTESESGAIPEALPPAPPAPPAGTASTEELFANLQAFQAQQAERELSQRLDEERQRDAFRHVLVGNADQPSALDHGSSSAELLENLLAHQQRVASGANERSKAPPAPERQSSHAELFENLRDYQQRQSAYAAALEQTRGPPVVTSLEPGDSSYSLFERLAAIRGNQPGASVEQAARASPTKSAGTSGGGVSKTKPVRFSDPDDSADEVTKTRDDAEAHKPLQNPGVKRVAQFSGGRSVSNPRPTDPALEDPDDSEEADELAKTRDGAVRMFGILETELSAEEVVGSRPFALLDGATQTAVRRVLRLVQRVQQFALDLHESLTDIDAGNATKIEWTDLQKAVGFLAKTADVQLVSAELGRVAERVAELEQTAAAAPGDSAAANGVIEARLDRLEAAAAAERSRLEARVSSLEAAALKQAHEHAAALSEAARRHAVSVARLESAAAADRDALAQIRARLDDHAGKLSAAAALPALPALPTKTSDAQVLALERRVAQLEATETSVVSEDADPAATQSHVQRLHERACRKIHQVQETVLQRLETESDALRDRVAAAERRAAASNAPPGPSDSADSIAKLQVQVANNTRTCRDLEGAVQQIDALKKRAAAAAEHQTDELDGVRARLQSLGRRVDGQAGAIEECSGQLARFQAEAWAALDRVPAGSGLASLEAQVDQLRTQLAQQQEVQDKAAANVVQLAQLVNSYEKLVYRIRDQLASGGVAVSARVKTCTTCDNTNGGGLAGATSEQGAQRHLDALFEQHAARWTKQLQRKVDHHVLEELLRHIATRSELQQWVREQLAAQGGTQSGDARFDELRRDVVALVDAAVAASSGRTADDGDAGVADTGLLLKVLESKLRKEVRRAVELQSGELRNQMTDRLCDMSALQKRQQAAATSRLETRLGELSALERDSVLRAVDERLHAQRQDDALQVANLAAGQLRADVDEKLALVGGQVSDCQMRLEQMLRQPWHRYGQWVWKSGGLKFDSAVPWNFETANSDPQNLRWDRDTTAIRIRDAGLYEVSFAFFTPAKPTIQLVVNGESVLSAINSSSYIVHHGSGLVVSDGKVEAGQVAGLSLLDFLALPAKSSLSLHYHGARKSSLGHGFLGLRRLG